LRSGDFTAEIAEDAEKTRGNRDRRVRLTSRHTLNGEMVI